MLLIFIKATDGVVALQLGQACMACTAQAPTLHANPLALFCSSVIQTDLHSMHTTKVAVSYKNKQHEAGPPYHAQACIAHHCHLRFVTRTWMFWGEVRALQPKQACIAS